MTEIIQNECVVIGAGPGGYAAAFRAADLGQRVVLIDKEESLGGVCLNRGCIPSKALLHLTKLIDDSKEAKKKGIVFDAPKINIEEIRSWKNAIISNLSSGISRSAKSRKVKIIIGTAKFQSINKLEVKNAESTTYTSFEKAIIATGSVSKTIPILPEDSDRIMGSKQALELNSVPEKLLVVGGGYIGLEMGMVYSTLGSKVTVVETLSQLLTGVDQDLVKPLQRKLSLQLENIFLNSVLVSGEETDEGIRAILKTPNGEFSETYDTVLVSVGRKPNTDSLGLENIGIEPDTSTEFKKMFSSWRDSFLCSGFTRSWSTPVRSWESVSTTVTLDPKVLYTIPISSPIYPPPTTRSFSGTELSSSACFEPIIRSESSGSIGMVFETEPVAMIAFSKDV
jgi:dihydrolipoamide dehydrogenase